MAPLKLAIIGGGPSAFYVASRLLSLFPKDEPLASQLRIHIYDRLWAPHGLVRYGVAPDHPEVKVCVFPPGPPVLSNAIPLSQNCTHKFDEVAADPRLRFFGNVQVGPQTPPAIAHSLPISLSALRPHYTHLLLSTGCTVPTLHAALPPSDRTIPALSLVHWYTQHPTRPSPPPLHRTEHVSVIGQGNVALDVARMLLTPPDVLDRYDVPASVLDVLHRSAVRHVSIIGRRGPLQAAFTTKELRELTTLPGASMLPLAPELVASPPAGTKLTRQQSRILQILQQRAQTTTTTTPGAATAERTWSLDFFRSPTGFTSDGRHLALAHTALDERSRAVPTGATSQLRTDLVVTALGHHADPESAYYDPASGHLRTDRGRVLDATGRALRRVYASGWAATGARGVLAATMIDAYAVADAILGDHFGDSSGAAGAGCSDDDDDDDDDALVSSSDVDPESVPREIEEGVRDKRIVRYDQWKKVDAEEVRRGEEGKERERMGWEEARDFLTRTAAW
ncbi:FAD/NAD-P-binding domain-containing protein [Russula earlei]|uniref:FAD/NAD-P-binding domain-containing protein n=1 Tax=Russula earlei TaxID=71964 RepID=A0ACC0U2D2_9AGAM|nr:FAD/NAD-P-binding domain-containing protein [Russula earlei]